MGNKNQYRDDVREFDREARWTLMRMLPFIILIVAIVGGIGFMTKSMGMWGKTVVERAVFENSYQYTAAQKARIATLEAQLAEIDSQLMNGHLEKDTRSLLEAQKRSINVQLSTARKLSQ